MNKSNAVTIGLLAIALLLAAPNLIHLIRGPAPTPDLFAQGYTLREAGELGAGSGKPVLVLVTADWCGACQSLKRGALSDERVAWWIGERTVPVYLEEGVDDEQIASLPVRAYPTTLVIDEGRVLGSVVGNDDPEGYLGRLRAIVEGS